MFQYGWHRDEPISQHIQSRDEAVLFQARRGGRGLPFPRHESVVGVPSQPIAIDWDEDGLVDLILAPEGRFFRRTRAEEEDRGV